MKKLIFNSTLVHKQSEYRPVTIEVEKVVLCSFGDTEIDTPEIDRSDFTESDFIAQLSPEWR